MVSVPDRARDGERRESGRGRGISVYRVDGPGTWTKIVITATEPNPSFLAADPARGIPPDCFVRTTPAELALTPDGRLLFASNRATTASSVSA